MWVTAYYAGWSQGWFDNGALPAEEIDCSAITHLIHFALVPNPDGSLDSLSNSIAQDNSSLLVSRAHSAGKKVLICVGGWGSDVAFRAATASSVVGSFAANLIGFMTRHGYDGIDIDWEVLDPSDSLQYVSFLALLSSRLHTRTPRPLLAGAVSWCPTLVAAASPYLDQINIMTYDLSGAWPGWVTWHNAPIRDGGFVFPSSGRPVPSANGLVDEFAAAGVPPGKLGIGIDFYGYVWSGGTMSPGGGANGPRESWSTAPSVQSNVPYSTIYADYYRPGNYRWDAAAEASYLSITSSADHVDKFVSFDDETACRHKVQYARSKGIGGVFIWELGGGYLPASYPNRDRLLQAVNDAYRGGGGSGGDSSSPGTVPAAYRLEQNFPNPFNASTTIQFGLPSAGNVTLKIYSALGQEVATLVSGAFPAGSYSAHFSSKGLPSGVYFYRLRSPSGVLTKKLMLVN